MRVVLSLIPAHVMLNVLRPATHTRSAIPASMPSMPIDTDMIEAYAPVLTHETALVATLHPEIVLPMHAGTCHKLAASDALAVTAVFAMPAYPASAVPALHCAVVPKTDAYALPRAMSVLEIERQPGADTHMHGMGEGFLGTFTPPMSSTQTTR